jgi:hypothetical protein
MRVAMLFVAILGLSACTDGETVVVQPDPPPPQTVVVPAEQPPALVICPSGSTAVYVDGVYRC